MAEIKKTFLRVLESKLPASSHYRYKFYKDYSLDALERGQRLYGLLAPVFPLENKRVLDLGCGYGGIAIYFAKKGCSVMAVDIDYSHVLGCLLRANEETVSLWTGVVAAEYLAFRNESFDLVILNDVVEHLRSLEATVGECARVLKRGGNILLTLPNRFALFNIFSDPHFGYFGITLMPIRLANFYTRRLRKDTFGYRVEHYPSIGKLCALFLQKDIKLRRIDLAQKYRQPYLIASECTRRLVLLVQKSWFFKILHSVGILQIFFSLYARFISRGTMLIGRKDGV